MDLIGKNTGPVTPAKNPHSNRSKISEISKHSENSNPNLTSPGLKSSKSPAIKSATTKTQKSAAKNPNHVASPSPRKKIRERKFVVAKRNSKKEKTDSTAIACKCKDKVGGDSQKCLCVAYETLRASQEEFFKNRGIIDDVVEEEEEEEKKLVIQTLDFSNGYERKPEEVDGLATNGSNGDHPVKIDQSGEMGSLQIKKRRDRSGKVMLLVKAFEGLLTMPNSKDSDQNDEKESEDDKKETEPASLGLHHNVPETQVSSSSFCPSDFFLTSESLGLDLRVSSSLDSSHGSFTISSRNSGGGHRSRRNSSESCGTFGGSRWKKKQHKATSQKPFKLRTEQRGKYKEEDFIKKVQQMMTEEEKQRIPIAQGIPWTTDEPECLVKPPVKDITRPVDLILHSDVRAVERAEFEQQMAEKMSRVVQYRMERERQQKLAEEEEIRRLRKELVPRAQPMPYFDRPFIPRRSLKNPTMPRDPKFHILQHKKIKCCMSWNDMLSIQTNNDMLSIQTNNEMQ